MLDYLKPNQVRFTACDLKYVSDSKGVRQPVYVFTLSHDRDAELRRGNSRTISISALSESQLKMIGNTSPAGGNGCLL